MKIKLVCFDLDGTLIDDYTFNRIFREAGKYEEYKKILDKWYHGRRSLKDFLLRVAQIIKGIKYETVERAVKKIKLMKGAEELISFLKSRNVKTAIITGTVQLSPKSVAEKLGIDYCVTNEWEVKDGVFTGNVKFVDLENEDKARLMKELAEKVECSLEEVVAIGDSISDIFMIERAGIGIAFNLEHDEVAEKADYVIKEKDLSKVIDILKDKV